jgi:2-polyprenyl-6-methoxyphenol hydroxylase-like FAD-dependent oxidoreductase
MATRPRRPPDRPPLDVLVVGAGPTGLTLAGQLSSMGSAIRVVDRSADRVHESRALAMQPRSLEVLGSLGVAGRLVELGNAAVRLEVRSGGRRYRLPLFDLGLEDTAYPFLLFLSQAETERVLNEHLAGRGVAVERPVELVALEQGKDAVTCALRREEGGTEEVAARFVAGCDGAHSTVRRLAGIPFDGSAYAPTFALADVEADGDLDPRVAYAYLAPAGVLLFFPLGRPTTWRVIGRLPDARGADERMELSEVQALVRSFTDDPIRLRDPAWLTGFGLQHRQARSYRTGRVFLAGDAAHVHSPAGAQGMNTGIQDAWNLGWKLALVSAEIADAALLDTYHAERWPVGRSVIRLSDRGFSAGTSTNRVAAFVRTQIAPRAVGLLARVPRARAAGFRTIAQLGVRYRRSRAVQEGTPAPKRGPRAGDRMPDAPIRQDGAERRLHEALTGPMFHLLLCGPPERWSKRRVDGLRERRADVLRVDRLTRTPTAGALYDDGGDAFRRLGVDDVAQYLVRPDGYIGFRSASTELGQVAAYLDRWLPESA